MSAGKWKWGDPQSVPTSVLDELDPKRPQPLTFAILGAAGFVAPRHMEAIRAIGGRIVAACDPSGAVGVLDRYAPDCRFFLYFEQFLSWLAREKETHHVVIATPNDLHVGQAKAVQEFGHVPIIEKPVGLTVAEAETLLGAPSVAVLQMRLHPEARRFVDYVRGSGDRKPIGISYNAPRGEWYGQSWKGDERRSGGVVTNIGIHVLDLLCLAAGSPTFAGRDVPREIAVLRGAFTTDPTRPVERLIRCGAETFNLSDAAGLHVEFYRRLARGEFTTVEDALPSIALAERLR